MIAFPNGCYSADILSRIPLRYVFYKFHSYHFSFYRSNQISDFHSNHYSFSLSWPRFKFDSLNSNSQPQEPSSNSLYSSEEILLPICLTLFTDPIPDSISDHDLINCNHNPIPNYILAKKKYKLVHLKIKPVIRELPDKFRIIKNIIGNPIKDLPTLLTDPPRFKHTGCYTKEQRDKFDKAHPSFLWPPEWHLLHCFMMIYNDVFAWDNSEHGHFREDFFFPADISVIPHKPWIQHNIPIPPGLYEELCKVVKQKLDAGVFEPSNCSYQSRWFCILKKDGKLLHIVQLEPLSQVTIAHSGVPPFKEQLAEQSAGCACNSLMDLPVGYDERTLAPFSCDLTTF